MEARWSATAGSKHWMDNPRAGNKQTVAGPMTSSGSFSFGKNRSVFAAQMLNPPSAPSGFSCSGGQNKTLHPVTDTNVKLADVNNGISIGAERLADLQWTHP